MAFRLSSALALASFVTSALADAEPIQQYSWYKNYYPTSEDYCFNGCYTVCDGITYNFTLPGGPLDYYLNLCSNTPKIQSIFYCAQKYCSHEEAVSGRNQLSPSCEENAGFPLPSVDSLLLSEEDLAQIPIINSTAALATADAPINGPVIPEPDWHDLGTRTVAKFYLNWDVSFDFTFALIGFWAFVLLVGMVHRASTFLKKAPGSGEASWWLWVRKTLILPATFKKHQAEAIGWTYTIPPRLESIILLLYVIMNFIMCFPAYDLFIGNQYYPAKNLQLARYVADRTGFLAIAQLPMVWVFAARNDPFMWLTGWSFATYNRFHRWIARISVAHAVIHSIAYTVFEFIEYDGAATGYYASYADQYWWCGVIATVIMCLMLGASAYYFRERYYDLFLIVHIAMSLIFFVTMWFHVKIFSGEFNYYLYPCIAIWAIDRLLRFGRTIFISVMPRFTKGVKATATYCRTTEMVRLDITDFMPEKKIVPGLYYYLYMPSGLRGYESHPFTLCSWRRSGASHPPSPSESALAKEMGASVRALSVDHTAEAETTHTMLVRPYAGMTGRLQKKLLSDDVSITSTQQTIFLEGPYGEKLDLSGYSDVLVVCGGSGITAAISHTHFLMAENPSTKIHIAWAVPQRHLPDDICANELASTIHTDRVNMTVYLTSAAEEEAHDPQKLPAHAPYAIKIGRPDIEAVMREHRQTASKSLAIVTCGTPQMSDVCRKAVVNVLNEKGVEVGYYNETMVW